MKIGVMPKLVVLQGATPQVMLPPYIIPQKPKNPAWGFRVQKNKQAVACPLIIPLAAAVKPLLKSVKRRVNHRYNKKPLLSYVKVTKPHNGSADNS